MIAGLVENEYRKIWDSLDIPNYQKEESWRKFSFKNFSKHSFSDFANLDYTRLIESHTGHNLGYSLTSSRDIFLPDWFLKEYNDYPSFQDLFWVTSLSGKDNGVYLNINEDVSIQDPIQLIHPTLSSGEIGAYFTLIRVGKHSKIKIIEDYNSIPGSEDSYQWFNSLTILDIQEGAQVEYIIREDHSKEAFNFRNLVSRQERDSSLDLFHYYQGGFRSKVRQYMYMAGIQSHLKAMGLGATSNREFVDHETEIRHRASHTSSSLIHKTVVEDRSHHIFTGNLHIPSNLSKVSASQVNHNLSLNPTARAESIPKLEIYSEDVQSSHGSTVGEIDEAQLFYLLARGLDTESANHLLVEAFLSELIDRISIESIRETIRNSLKEKIWPTKN